MPGLEDFQFGVIGNDVGSGAVRKPAVVNRARALEGKELT